GGLDCVFKTESRGVGSHEAVYGQIVAHTLAQHFVEQVALREDAYQSPLVADERTAEALALDRFYRVPQALSSVDECRWSKRKMPDLRFAQSRRNRHTSPSKCRLELKVTVTEDIVGNCLRREYAYRLPFVDYRNMTVSTHGHPVDHHTYRVHW